jgi:hypothetical protein
VRARASTCVHGERSYSRTQAMRAWWGACWREGGMAGGRWAVRVRPALSLRARLSPRRRGRRHGRRRTRAAAPRRIAARGLARGSALHPERKDWSGGGAERHATDWAGRGRTGADPEGRWLGAVPQRQLAPARGAGGTLLSTRRQAYGSMGAGGGRCAAGHSTSLTTQHACNMQHAACSVQRAAYNMQRNSSVQHTALQHAAMRHKCAHAMPRALP